MSLFHHVELWVPDLSRARTEWGWLLTQVGCERKHVWAEGESWGSGDSYLTLCRPPTLSGADHDRRRPGLNHLAFAAGTAAVIDDLMKTAPQHGWTQLYADRYPHAGGPEHYAGWVENQSGFKVELVATRW